MKTRKKFGFFSQGYEAPRAEGVEVAQESVLCASPVEVDGGLQGFTNDATPGNWGDGN